MPFGINLPDYFPAKHNFSETVHYLQSNRGVAVFPYLNARLWDLNAESYALYLFRAWNSLMSSCIVSPPVLLSAASPCPPSFFFSIWNGRFERKDPHLIHRFLVGLTIPRAQVQRLLPKGSLLLPCRSIRRVTIHKHLPLCVRTLHFGKQL